MSDDYEITNGSSHVRIKGLRKTLRHLEQSGADAQDMRDLMFDLGSIVVKAAQPPEVSGTLGATVRAGRGKTKAVVRAGGAKAPYAGVVHYGWPARGITAQPFLTDALQRNRAHVFRELDRGLAEILKANKLA